MAGQLTQNAVPNGSTGTLFLPDGRPYLIFSSDFDSSRLVSCDLSISHAGGMIVAVVVALLSFPVPSPGGSGVSR